VPYWSGCFAGGAMMDADGGVVAHGWQLQAVARRDCSLPLVFRFAFSSLHYQASSLSTLPIYFSLKFPPLFQASPCSFLPFSLSSPFVFFFSLFSPLLSLFLSFRPPFSLLALSGIYRAKGSRGVPIVALSRTWGAGSAYLTTARAS